jgi:hypothetical protein
MFQVMVEYAKSWPEKGPLQVNAYLQGDIAIPPEKARRCAAGYLAGHVSMMLLAGDPVLVMADEPKWHIPAVLYLPGLGAVTTIGTIAVDAKTGVIIPLRPEQILTMQERANEFAARFTPSSESTS